MERDEEDVDDEDGTVLGMLTIFTDDDEDDSGIGRDTCPPLMTWFIPSSIIILTDKPSY